MYAPHLVNAAPRDPISNNRGFLMGQDFERLLSDAEAGTLLGLHPKTVQRMARRGELPAVHIGRYWRFRASALNSWIALHSTCQPACVASERTQ